MKTVVTIEFPGKTEVKNCKKIPLQSYNRQFTFVWSWFFTISMALSVNSIVE